MVIHAVAFIDGRVGAGVLGRPVAGVMAGTTIRAEQATMVGWLPMARSTSRGCAGKLSVLMTALTRQARMGSGEREFGERVVEGSRFPGCGTMAGSAVHPKAAGMFVVLGMAGTAGGAHL
jgi:hypothetical protein